MAETEPKLELKREVFEALPISIQKGIEELKNRFLIMFHSSYSGDSFVHQIQDSIETFFLVLEAAYNDEDGASLLLNQVNSVEDGIAFIRGAITNRLQAARYLYEPSLFSPHTMGPFSDLYLFYENFVDLFEKLIKEYNKIKDNSTEQSRISFLIDISVYSSVSARPFVPLSWKQIPNDALVGITINEHAFFQIKSTIVMLLHEIGHYVRPFNRIKRNNLLRDIVFNWLTDMVFSQLKDYLYLGIFYPNSKFRDDKEKENVDKVREYFERELIPMIDPVITFTLKKHFDKFLMTKSVISEFEGENPNSSFLWQYQDLLDNYLTDLSVKLGRALFAPEEVPSSEDAVLQSGERVPNSPISTNILEFLDDEVKLSKQTEAKSSVKGVSSENTEQQIIITKTPYFDALCEKATALFNPGKLFAPKTEPEATKPDLLIYTYLKSLSLLGVNENNKTNKEHFTKVLMQCMKMAVEQMKDEDVVETLIGNLDEVLAHMFWIRTLNIKDFDSYWKIVEPLMRQTAFDDGRIINEFGVPNAIITEYFDLLEPGRRTDHTKYNILAFNASALSRTASSRSWSSKEMKWLEVLRDMVFVPIAEYLHEEDEVFPEKQFFQLSDIEKVSEERRLIVKLREDFSQFILETKDGEKFAQEMQMINFFNRQSGVGS